MKKILLASILCFFSLNAVAVTSYNLGAPTTRYTYDGEAYFIDYNNASSYNTDTGVTTYDPVSYVRDFYNPNLSGNLYFWQIGNFFAYQSNAGSANSQADFNVRLFMKDGDNLIVDYTMNILPIADVYQLLDVPSFNMSTTNSSVSFVISAFDRATAQIVPRNEITVSPATSGPYAASNGSIIPILGFNDVFTYTANPGFSGWETILIFSRDRAGKRGYNFFNIFVSP